MADDPNDPRCTVCGELESDHTAERCPLRATTFDRPGDTGALKLLRLAARQAIADQLRITASNGGSRCMGL
jgi:hypothetical protein